MALCNGERKTSRAACNGTLYKCSRCGNTGCQQTKEDGCSSQAFSVLQRCLQCGAVAQRTALSDVKSDRAPRKTPSLI